MLLNIGKSIGGAWAMCLKDFDLGFLGSYSGIATLFFGTATLMKKCPEKCSVLPRLRGAIKKRTTAHLPYFRLRLSGF